MMLLAMALAAQVDLRPLNLGSCTPATAQNVSVRQLASRPRRYEGRCVTVSGPTYATRMYASVPSIYLSVKRGSDGQVPARNLTGRLGLYFGSGSDGDGRPLLPTELLDGYRPVTVTGVVDSCERMGRALPGRPVEQADPETGEMTVTVTMLGGYCHSSGGAVLWVTRSSVDSAGRYERLVGQVAGDRFGRLVPAPSEWRHFRPLRNLANRFHGAVSAGHRAELSKLFGKFGAASSTLQFLLDDPASPFVDLRGGKRRLPFIILVEEWDQDGVPAADRRTQDAVICFCRTNDCSALWPIAKMDAVADPDHPYACVGVSEDATRSVFLNDLTYGGVSAPLKEPGAR
jgi:hypothetical protein